MLEDRGLLRPADRDRESEPVETDLFKEDEEDLEDGAGAAAAAFFLAPPRGLLVCGRDLKRIFRILLIQITS